jgi:hypothetical protein
LSGEAKALHERLLTTLGRLPPATYTERVKPATIIPYWRYDPTLVRTCPACGWQGNREASIVNHHSDLLDVCCPRCEKMLVVVPYPTERDAERMDADRKSAEILSRFREHYAAYMAAKEEAQEPSRFTRLLRKLLG